MNLRDDIIVRSNGSPEGRAFVAHFQEISRAYGQQERDWVDLMLEQHAPALIHPDDGWVDRQNSTITPCYPRFQRRVEVGDTIVLGCHLKWRIVRCTEVIKRPLRWHDDDRVYRFEESG